MKILILAYASEPGAGSEYGVGWMVPTIMAKRHPEHEIYVLTRSRCREKIRLLQSSSRGEVINTTEQCDVMPNLHFLFYDIPSWLFYKKEMGSRWGEQYNYLLWQLFARRYVAKMHKKIGFDVVHHLTFNQYRTPSPGFFVNIPFVMGPIGGAETIADAFLQDLAEHTAKKEQFRKKGRDLRLFGAWVKARKNKKIILCSTKENVERLAPHCGTHKCEMMPAIAFTQNDFDHLEAAPTTDLFTIIYAGKALDWKGIKIFLKAAKKAYIDNDIVDFNIKLIGIRSEEEQHMVMGWVEENGLLNNVELIPFIARADLLVELSKCNMSVYPAFRDSGSMSVLEASALACPTICFDAGGQDAFPDDILLKIQVKETYDECLSEFAEKLLWAHDNREQLRLIGEKSKTWVGNNLIWEKKVDDFIKVYEEIIKE